MKKLVMICAAVSMVLAVSGVRAGTITSVTYTDDQSYTAGQFSSASYNYIYDQSFSLPKFEPSLGYLKKVEITMTLVSGAWSKMEVDSEHPDIEYGQWLFVGGYFVGQYPDIYINESGQGYSVPNSYFLTGPTNESILILGVDSDNLPDYTGSDYITLNGSLGASKFQKSTINPLPGWQGGPNENPFFQDYVHYPGGSATVQDMWYSVASAMASPYYDDTARRHTNGNVSVRGQVKYTYEEIPEPATICMLGLGALGLLRKRRA